MEQVRSALPRRRCSGRCTVATAALAAFFFDHIEWDLIPRFNAPRELFVIYRVH